MTTVVIRKSNPLFLKALLWKYGMISFHTSRMNACKRAKSLQSCLTLCDPMDCSPPSSSIHGILQARILEKAAMPSSRGSSRPRDQTQVSNVSCIGRWVLLPWRYLGSLRKALESGKSGPKSQLYFWLIDQSWTCHPSEPQFLTCNLKIKYRLCKSKWHDAWKCLVYARCSINK